MPASLDTFTNPPTEFSVLPFWFWNDGLDADEIRRQIADFDVHGVHGFMIHPRVGLPRALGWMSEGLLAFYDVAIEAAARPLAKAKEAMLGENESSIAVARRRADVGGNRGYVVPFA